MSIIINGTGSITGLTAGGLPDGSVVTADIADANITAAKLDGAQSGSAPIYGCRAWVNFDGTRDTTGAVSTANTNRLIRASGNVTSVLRNGAGDYTVTFTTAMPDANYCAVATGALDNTTGGRSSVASINSYSTGSVKLFTTRSSTAAFEDDLFCNLSIFR